MQGISNMDNVNQNPVGPGMDDVPVRSFVISDDENDCAALDLGCNLNLQGGAEQEVENASIFVIRISPKGKVIEWSLAAEETLGVKALGEHLENEFGLPHRFIDVPTGF